MTDQSLTLFNDRQAVVALADRIAEFLPGAKDAPRDVQLATAQIALAHGLDPFMRELWPIPQKDKEGRIVGWSIMVGIAGWRSAAHRSGEYWGRRFEKCTPEERAALGVGQNDLAIRCVVLRRKTGAQPMEFDGYGVYRQGERTKMNPLQCVRLRAERDAMKAAFPISFGGGAGPRVVIADEQGEVIDDGDHSKPDRGQGWEVVKPEGEAGNEPIEPPATQPVTDNGNGKPTKAQSWPAAIVQAIIQEGLAKNPYEAVGMLNKSKVITPATEPEIVITWARMYRALREAGNEPDQAAALADGEEVEMAEAAGSGPGT